MTRVKCINPTCMAAIHGMRMGRYMKPWHGRRKGSVAESTQEPCPVCGGLVAVSSPTRAQASKDA